MSSTAPAADEAPHVHEGVPRPGDVLAGKYRVEKVLGVGGMGVVLSATHLQLDERVAIKFLLSDGLKNAEVVGRFAREARAAVKIKSEHVARVIDVGSLETGAPYMVMEYLEGGDLSAVLERDGALPVEMAVEYVLQACEAIGEAHTLGIVHRDLKPPNLFLANRPGGGKTIKVLDFGISKVTGKLGAGSGAEASMTRTSAIIGSPLYMSPEQLASSRDVDARTDIWAIGVILYELLANNPPFMGETLPQLLTAILTKAPTPLREIRPDVPVELEAVILRCMARDVSQRWADVAELADGLAPFAPRHGDGLAERVSRVTRGVSHSAANYEMVGGVRASGPFASLTSAGKGTGTLGPRPAGSQAAHVLTAGTWGQTHPGKNASRAGVIGAASAAVVAAAAIGFFVLRGHPTQQSSSTSTSVAAETRSVAAAVPGTTSTAAPAVSASAATAPEIMVVPAAAPASAAASPADLAPDAGAPASVAGHKAVPVPPVTGGRVPGATTAAPAKPPVPAQPAGSLFDDRK